MNEKQVVFEQKSPKGGCVFSLYAEDKKERLSEAFADLTGSQVFALDRYIHSLEELVIISMQKAVPLMEAEGRERERRLQIAGFCDDELTIHLTSIYKNVAVYTKSHFHLETNKAYFAEINFCYTGLLAE